jgi:hypothetical protein
MPLGKQYDEIGWLNDGPEGLVLRRDDGGRWRLDVGFFAARRCRSLLGQRVRVTGTRAEFDLLDVRSVEAL